MNTKHSLSHPLPITLEGPEPRFTRFGRRVSYVLNDLAVIGMFILLTIVMFIAGYIMGGPE